MLKSLTLLVGLAGLAQSQFAAPDRCVQGSTLISQQDSDVRLQLQTPLRMTNSYCKSTT